MKLKREKRARQNVFHFACAINGVPAKLVLWGKVRKTVGLSHLGKL